MRQFDLDEYLKDTTQKVVTRDGRSARIVCTDAHSDDYPVIALVMTGGCECGSSFTRDGEYYKHRKNDDDLFFADKETYRPYANAEECFKDVVKHGGWVRNCAGQYIHILAVKENSMLYAGDMSYPHERAHRNWVWADDGTPCGVKEE